MAGFVIDIWIAFLIRTAINAWKWITGVRWPVSNGCISDYRYIRPLIGCDYGQYIYTYSVDGRLFKGVHTDPYFVSRSRDAQVSRSVGASARVGVDPKDPVKSVLKSF